MATKKRPPRARTVERERARESEKLFDKRERLFLLAKGSTASLPMDLVSASAVESRAATFRCPRCDSRIRIGEHRALTVGDDRLREVVIHCDACRKHWSLWFRLTSALLN